MSLLSSVKISDVPETKAESFKGIGTIGEVKETEVANGKIQVAIPLQYERENGSEATFTVRVFLDPAWFDPSYKPFVASEQEKGSDEYREAFAYQLNMSKIVRKLFKILSLDEINFDQLEGKQVGFSIGPESDKRDPSRQELKSLYEAK